MSTEDQAEQEYIEASITVDNSAVDAVCNYIIENICSGLALEEEEDSDITVVKFYVPATKDDDYLTHLADYLSCLTDGAEEQTPAVRTKKIKSGDWALQYRKAARAVVATEGVIVRPPWAERSLDVEYDIIIEPKMAFGTGSHETTRSCLKALRDRFQNGMSFLDFGCGSGILSILASMMGASYIKAIDYDLVAVDNSRENFSVNHVTCRYDILFGSISKCRGDQPYDFVCANIIKSVILESLPRLIQLTKENGHLVLSGLLEKDVPEIIGSLEKDKQTEYDIYPDNEWRTILVEKK